MSGKILIIDPVSTNRIVLRVKMLAAQYIVESCEHLEEAQNYVTSFVPDLILINLAAVGEAGFAFCRNLRTDPRTQAIAQVSVGAAIAAQGRMNAFNAGLDDIMSAPINDSLLMSRVRSLLRQRSVLGDLIDRDGATARHLGFGEGRARLAAPMRITILGQSTTAAISLARSLTKHTGLPVTSAQSIGELSERAAPDVVVINGVRGAQGVVGLSEMISDLRARAATCQTAQLVIVPRWAEHQAAMALDLGADDVVFDDTPRSEIALRAMRLADRKGQYDHLRNEVRAGLQAAITDPLTGLRNRHYANGFMQRLQQSAQTCGQGYAMILLDIDHFKAINDTYGHAAGDDVLVEVGRRLQTAIGQVDLCARIGGEEFLIVMSRTAMSGAREMAEVLRKTVASVAFDIEGQPIRVTLSAGVAVHDPLCGANARHDCPLGPLYAKADAALYDAKSAGRDAVSCAQSAAA